MNLFQLISIAQQIGATKRIERVDLDDYSDYQLRNLIAHYSLSKEGEYYSIMLNQKNEGGIVYRTKEIDCNILNLSVGVIHKNYSDALLYSLSKLGIEINPLTIKL